MTPLLAYPVVAEILENKIPILLLALAIDGGSPRKIRAGKVSKDPPPPSVFIAPAIKPTKTKIKKSIGSFKYILTNLNKLNF